MTRRPDEIALWDAAFKSADPFQPRPIDDLAQELGIPYKRARYLALKWSDKGLTDYGVSWRHSWLRPGKETSEGRREAAEREQWRAVEEASAQSLPRATAEAIGESWEREP